MEQLTLGGTPNIVERIEGVQEETLRDQERCLPFLNLMDLLTRHLEGRSSSFSQPTLKMVVVKRMESSQPGPPGVGEERGAGEGGVGDLEPGWQSE